MITKRIIAFFIFSSSFLAVFSYNLQLRPKANENSVFTLVNSTSVDSSKSVIPENNSINSTSNSTQNNMTILALAIALIAVAVALIGHKSNQVDKIKKDLDSLRDNEITSLQNEVDKLKKSIEEERQSTIRLSHLLQKLNESLYYNFKAIEEGKSSDELRRIITLNYHITLLYISCLIYDKHDISETSSINLFDTFSYLKEYGEIKEIKHLNYVAENNLDRKNREQALETIGFIKNNPNKKKDPTN